VIAVLQFDSASAALVESMLAEDRLPNLAALRSAGRHLELDTPATDFAAGAFYTLYSGVELGDHGIFYPFQWDAAQQRIRFATAFEAPPAVWERLAASGLRTLAIDPYESRPPREAEGVFACGIGFSDRVVLPRWSLPSAESRRLRRRLGRAPDATEVFGRPSARRLLALREVMLEAPGRVAAAATAYLARESFDLAWITFAASHVAGHQFWDLSQLERSALGEADRQTISATLPEVYAAVDRGIGEVVEALPPGCDVVVASAVGMDVNTSAADLLPGMLDAVLRGEAAPEAGRGGSIWRLRGAIPSSWRSAVARAIPPRAALALTARLELRGERWDRRSAFAHPADNQGYVRLNLRGRERDGIVDAADADELCGRIATGLMSFRDPGGEAIVEAVVRSGELYPGERSARLPDLVVRWRARPATALAEVRSDSLGVVRRQGGGSGRSGNHTAGDAWALVVPGGSSLREPSRAPRLVDVAATVCEVTGADSRGLPGESLLSPQAQGEDGRRRSSAKPAPVAS